MVINYESLIREPRRGGMQLYDFLPEPWYEHEYENIAFDEPGYDADLGMPGLHRVRPKVSPEPRAISIPPDLFAKYADVNFWLSPKLDPRNVPVL